jgi:hypothetical protein
MKTKKLAKQIAKKVRKAAKAVPVVYDSMQVTNHVHGHNGATVVEFLDP